MKKIVFLSLLIMPMMVLSACSRNVANAPTSQDTVVPVETEGVPVVNPVDEATINTIENSDTDEAAIEAADQAVEAAFDQISPEEFDDDLQDLEL